MKSKTPKPDSPALLRLVCRALDDKKAEDIRVLCVKAQSSITDYLILATGTSDPHLRALRVELEKVIDAAKEGILGMDTTDGSGWIVIDAFDVMVHIFTPETRDKYALENLWKDAEEVPLATVLADATTAQRKPRKKSAATATKRKRRTG